MCINIRKYCNEKMLANAMHGENESEKDYKSEYTYLYIILTVNLHT